MSNRLTTIETDIFNYINSELELTGTGSRSEFARAAPQTTVSLWSLQMFTGAENAIAVNRDETIYAWTVPAEFRGLYTSRDTLLGDLWIVMNDLPWETTDIDSIQAVWPITTPVVPRDTFRIENDQSEGGETRVWACTLPLEVVFERS
jgi:hypothetical protein